MMGMGEEEIQLAKDIIAISKGAVWVITGIVTSILALSRWVYTQQTKHREASKERKRLFEENAKLDARVKKAEEVMQSTITTSEVLSAIVVRLEKAVDKLEGKQ